MSNCLLLLFFVLLLSLTALIFSFDLIPIDYLEKMKIGKMNLLEKFMVDRLEIMTSEEGSSYMGRSRNW